MHHFKAEEITLDITKEILKDLLPEKSGASDCSGHKRSRS